MSQSIDAFADNELYAIKKKRTELVSREKHGLLHRFILFSCILTNIIFLLTLRDYFAIFIAASFYLNMFYFISLLIPTGFDRSVLSGNEIIRFHAWLGTSGIKTGTSRFTRLFVNSFLINSRALSLGIGWIFSVDIVFALLSYAVMDLPTNTAIIVIVQCSIIILFYFLVWKIEPFSTEFKRNVEQVKRRLTKESIPSWLVSVIFMSGILLAVFLFLTAIILLPGITVTEFMNQSGLNKAGYLVSFITILAVTQYFLIRYIHGITSRTMAARILDFQEVALKEMMRVRDTRRTRKSAAGEDWSETTALFLESRCYSIRQHSLAGLFPVYIVDIDFSNLMDSTTRAAIGQYIEWQKDSPGDRP